MRLPRVLVTSVIRSSHQGESHGGAYLVDLEHGHTEQVLDWDDGRIDWQGRGGDRGLRGIAYHAGRIILAASNEVFVFDASFRLQGSIANRYLRHCHEIAVQGERLLLTSTGFDSVLEYDLAAERFTRGWHLSWAGLRGRVRRRLSRAGLRSTPRLRVFDPERDGGPVPGDHCHLNMVGFHDGGVHVSGTLLGQLYRIEADRLRAAGRLPWGTHNAQPFRGGVLVNATAEDAVLWLDRSGRTLARFPVPHYPPSQLCHADLDADHARPGFARGLCVAADRFVIAGSSPATVTVYDVETRAERRRLNLTLDVRNAVHGLEVWPFDDVAQPGSTGRHEPDVAT